MVTLIKVIGDDAHSTVIVAGRCVFGLALLLPAFYRYGFSELRSPKISLHLIRGCFVAAAINLGFYSLTILPITTVTVLFFSAPLFVTMLAYPMLGEKVGIRRVMATLVGFCGTIVVLDPAVENFDSRLLIPVISSVFFSVSLVLNKKLSRIDPPRVLMFYMFLVTLILTSPIALYYFEVGKVTLPLLGMILVIAVFATLRTYSDIRGYSLGDVSFVAPFQYLRILFVAVSAFLFFGEVLKRNEWIGMFIIVLSTLYIAHREYRMNLSPTTENGKSLNTV